MLCAARSRPSRDATGLDVVIESDRPRHDICRGCLTDFEWIAADIVSVQLDQIEGVQERAAVMASIADVIEAHHAFAVADHRLTIDDAGSRTQPRQSLDDQRKAVGQVIAWAAVEPHFHAVLAGAKAVVLDFMQPQWPGGRPSAR
jgi:hypothetical protein